jgi:hypothetical protein
VRELISGELDGSESGERLTGIGPVKSDRIAHVRASAAVVRNRGAMTRAGGAPVPNPASAHADCADVLEPRPKVCL